MSQPDPIEIAKRWADFESKVNERSWDLDYRVERLIALHKQAEAAGNADLDRDLRFEVLLFMANIVWWPNANSDSPRFTAFHPDLTSDAGLGSLAQRLKGSRLTAAFAADFLWEFGGQQGRRQGPTAARAYWDCAEELVHLPSGENAFDIWYRITDALARGATLAMRSGRTDLAKAIVDRTLELIDDQFRLANLRPILDLAAASLKARGAFSPQKLERLGATLDSCLIAYQKDGPLNSSLLLGGLLELRRTVAGLLSDQAKMAEADDLTAQMWIREAEGSSSNSVKAHFYEKAIAYLERVPSAREQINDLKLKRRAAYQTALEKEFTTVKIEVPFDTKQLTALIDKYASLAPADALGAVAGSGDFRFNIAQARDYVKRQKETAPLLNMFPTITLRSAGISQLPENPQQAEERQLMDAVAILRHIQDELLAEIFERLSQSGLTIGTFVDYLRASKNFDEDNLSFIAVGIERSLAHDYVSALHVLVPRVEDVMRRLAVRAGIDTMRADVDRPGTTQEGVLANAMTALAKAGVLDDDVRFMFESVLDSPFGVNLRNDISHGLVVPDVFNEAMTARVWHLLLVVASLAIRDGAERMVG